MPLSLRPFEPEDTPLVDALHRSVDWPVRSADGWAWLRANPARPKDFPIGWLAGSDDDAAFVGQFPQRFHAGAEAFLGVTGYSIIVPPALRGAAAPLIRRVMDRPDAAFHYTLNANALSAPLYRRHGLRPWPPETHDLKLAWMIDPVVCAAAGLARRLAPDRSGQPGPERLLKRKSDRRPDLRLPPNVEPLAGFDAQWDDFWRRLRETGAIFADRSAATMRWRLADPDRTSPPVMLVFRQNGAVTGWVMAQMAKMSRHEPPVLDIIDLAAAPDESDAIQTLTGTLIRNAGRLGAAKVRLQVVSPSLAAALGPLAKRARREGGWGHAHARLAPDRDPKLLDRWAPTPFDGDYGFCLRPVPRA